MTPIEELIGIPFVYGARGPDSFDCYGLVKHCYREYKKVLLPDYVSPSNESTTGAFIFGKITLGPWAEVEKQSHVAIVFKLANGRWHVGYTLPDSDWFIHTWEHSGGVLIERVDSWKLKLVGFYDFTE